MESSAPAATLKDALDGKTPSAAAGQGQCELRFLMVNSESFRIVVPVSSTVQDVKQKVIDERPKELMDFWRESKPSVSQGPDVGEIRILHLGKFLDDEKTLKEYKFASGAENLTTVHISVRVPTNGSDEVKEKVNKKTAACCIIM